MAHELSLWLPSLAIIAMVCGLASAGEEASGTEVDRWHGGTKTAFLLFFDDNCPSHIKNAIPELKKRNLIGTFYVCPGNNLWTAWWQKEFPATGMALGNHTMHHKFVAEIADLDKEIKDCSEALAKLYPDRKEPCLMSYGRPGTNPPLKFTEAQVKEVLPKYNLIHRPPIAMFGPHLKNGKDMCNAVDKAISSGKVGNALFHGVGGDWLSVPMPDYLELLDHLVAKKDDVWQTDHISAHKYETERSTAEVKLVKKDDKQIRLSLTSKADPKLYDQPLTLTTKVPADWQKCEVVQGERKATVAAEQGAIRYPAVPGGEEIAIQPAK